jgi:hypothetical protein
MSRVWEGFWVVFAGTIKSDSYGSGTAHKAATFSMLSQLQTE